MTKKEILSSEQAPAAVGPYSAAVRTGNLVFLSGQLGLNPSSGEFVAGGISEQTKQSLLNIESVLKSNDMSIKNIIKTTVFLKNMKDFSKMNKVYGEVFTDTFPARSTVEVASLPKNGLVEIEAIAYYE